MVSHTHLGTYTYTHACTHMHAHMHTHTHTHTHTHIGWIIPQCEVSTVNANKCSCKL